MAARASTFNGTTYSLPGLGDTDWNGQVNAWMDDVSAHAVTLTGTQTLTNKSLTAPTITGAATIAVTWTAPTLAGTWANNGGGASVAEYMKDAMGMVHLKGWIGGGGASTIFTLPTGFRPALDMYLAVFTTADAITATSGLVKVSTAGVVTLEIGSRVAVSLEALCFKAA